MKLHEFAGAKKLSTLAFSAITFDLTENLKKIAILHLTAPLPLVLGSQFVQDEASGERIRIEAYDVETVKVHQNEMVDDGFEIKEDGSGTYNGDLFLDVAKGSGEVWLKAEKFSAASRRMRNDSRTERQGGMIAKIKARSIKQNGTSSNPNKTVNATTTGTEEKEKEPAIGG